MLSFLIILQLFISELHRKQIFHCFIFNRNYDLGLYTQKKVYTQPPNGLRGSNSTPVSCPSLPNLIIVKPVQTDTSLAQPSLRILEPLHENLNGEGVLPYKDCAYSHPHNKISCLEERGIQQLPGGFQATSKEPI